MGFFKFLSKLKTGEIVDAVTGETICDNGKGEMETAIKEIAWESGLRIIANAVSKCEFKTIKNGTEVKGKEYYLLNVKPNQNQNSTQFWSKVIHKLFEREDNDCLIFENNNMLYCADDFSIDKYAFRDYVFSNISIDGLTLREVKCISDVIYLKLNGDSISRIANCTARRIEKTISSAMEGYDFKTGTHGTMELQTQAGFIGGKDPIKSSGDAFNHDFKNFFKSKNAVMPLFNGYRFNTIKPSAEIPANELKTLLDLEFECVSRALNIPVSILRGEVADTKNAVDNLLTFGIDPLADLIGEEFTSKRYSMEEFLSGSKTYVDTTSVKHVDTMDVAASVDKLISSGCFSVNEIRALLGMSSINEDWANKHFITKNYEDIETAKQLEGGEKK